MWKRLIGYPPTLIRPSTLVRHSNSTHQQLSLVQRTRKYFNDNPYFVVSLGFVGVVLIFGFIVDSITRKKKVSANLYQCLPPRPCHSIISLYSAAPLVDKHVLLTGPEACGKTTLAFRTSQLFLQQQSFWSRKEPRVFYVDGNSKESFIMSLRECLLSYGLTDVDILPKGKLFHHLPTDEQLQTLTSSLKLKLTSSKNRWLLIVDNINENTLQLFTSLAPSLTDGRIIAVSHDPLILPALRQSIPSLQHVSIDR